MSIINPATGQNYSDADIQGYLKTATPDQIAQQSASLGLTRDQIAGALQTGGRAANQNDAYAQIDSFTGANNGYSFGANGAAMKSPAPAPATPAAPGGITIGGQNYTADQVRQQYTDPNFNDVQWLQQHGINDLGQIHEIANKARGIAGNLNPTGDAALQQQFQRYKQVSPNGAFAGDYNGFVNSLNPASASAIRGGGYTGAPISQTDYQFGGIYGPGSSAYGQPGYASGLGPLGNGGSWNTPGTGGSPSSPGNPGSAGGGGGTPQLGGGIINGGAVGGGAGGAYGAYGGGITPWNVTPNQTVEGRIQSIMNSGSPLQQIARTSANESMNGRGLLNSSIAGTASDLAAYQAAIPIAQADAATQAKATGYNADQSNQFATNALNRQSTEGIANLQSRTQLGTAQISANTQLTTAQLSSDTQKVLASMDITNRQQMLAIQNANATLLQTNANAVSLLNVGANAISTITNNEKMDAAAKTQATANIQRNLQAQLSIIGKTSNLDLTTNLNLANYPGFDGQGNWIGFPAGGAAASSPAAQAAAASGYQADSGSTPGAPIVGIPGYRG